MLIIAHRANGFGFPENSIKAILACVDAGFVPEIDTWPGGLLGHDEPDSDAPTIWDALDRRFRIPRLEHQKWSRRFVPVKCLVEKPYLEFDQDGDVGLISECRGVVLTATGDWPTRAWIQRNIPRTRIVLVAGEPVFQRNERRWGELYEMGVDGILTDEPYALQAFLRSLGK